MEKFKKLLMSKKAKPVSDVEKSAKMDVLKDLKQHAMDMMGEKLGSVKKVTVASNSKEGIEKGLDKAKEMIKKTPEDSENVTEEACPECEGEGCPACQEESAEHEASETPEEETSEHEMGEEPSDESEEELDAKIQELMKKKEAIKAKK
jgi:hypothetical protein